MRSGALGTGLVAICLAVSGCNAGPDRLARLEKDLKRGQGMARNCLFDTYDVSLQNSAHCVAIAQFLSDQSLLKACPTEKHSFHCDRLWREKEFLHFVYSRAVVSSLYRHGLPKNFEPASAAGRGGFLQFYDAALLAKGYADCLAEEKAARKQGVNLLVDPAPPRRVAATSIHMPMLLAPGQLCIREDYAEPFKEAAT